MSDFLEFTIYYVVKVYNIKEERCTYSLGTVSQRIALEKTVIVDIQKAWGMDIRGDLERKVCSFETLDDYFFETLENWVEKN